MVSTGSVATLVVVFSVYLGEAVPLSPLDMKLAAVAMIAAVTAVNIRGARHSSNFQNWTTFIIVGAIVFLRAAEGLAIVLAGVPTYFFWRLRGKRAVASEGKERQTPG